MRTLRIVLIYSLLNFTEDKRTKNFQGPQRLLFTTL